MLAQVATTSIYCPIDEHYSDTSSTYEVRATGCGHTSANSTMSGSPVIADEVEGIVCDALAGMRSCFCNLVQRGTHRRPVPLRQCRGAGHAHIGPVIDARVAPAFHLQPGSLLRVDRAFLFRRECARRKCLGRIRSM